MASLQNLSMYVTGPFSWIWKTRKMCKLVENYDRSVTHGSGCKQVAVILLPWVSTDVPWFSVVFGLLLSHHGDDVVFVVDDLPFGDKPFRFKFILAFIKIVMKRLSENFEILVLSEFLRQNDNSKCNVADIDDHVRLNTVWSLRGELTLSGRERYSSLIKRQLLVSSYAIETLLSTHHFESILIPGGIYGSSGIWKECACSRGVRVATYDSGYETLLLAADGVASQLQDIPRAMSMLKSRPEFKRELPKVVAEARKELNRRMTGKDKFSSQLAAAPTTKSIKKRGETVLLALNSPWDSAALGLHIVFKDTRQWIVETTDWILENTVADIVIRQHPAERLSIARSKDDYKQYLHDVFGENSRIQFIAAEDPVNTYDLLAEIRTVIVYTSTIGVEAALLGNKVITASRCYYSTLGFVLQADTKEKYFRFINESLSGEFGTNEHQQQDAAICYYLTQCNNWIFTKFNPHVFDYWGNQDISDLYRDKKIHMCIEAVSENVPISILNYLSKLHNGIRG